MSYNPDEDHRLDSRHRTVLSALAENFGPEESVADRNALLASVNTPQAKALEAARVATFDAAHDLDLAPMQGLRTETFEIRSEPDGNTIKLLYFRPDNDAIVPCVYYIHGGGMMVMSCFYGTYRTWGRLLAHQGIGVVMVEFRNALIPSAVPAVAPFPAGLNDCVSGFKWSHDNAGRLGIDPQKILIAGESGGGNLSIATTMQLAKDGHGNLPLGLYAMCPYIAGEWPRPEYPSSTENEGIFISVQNNRGAMAYGIEELKNQNPLAWPHFATESDVSKFPPTMISVNECDPLRDEGIAFFRLLQRAGVKANCRQVMGSVHGSDMFGAVFPEMSRVTARDIRGWIEECQF